MNPVYVYLSNNKGKKLSINKISKVIGIKKKAAFYYVFRDSRIRRVNGYEIGCGKNTMSVFTIDP